MKFDTLFTHFFRNIITITISLAIPKTLTTHPCEADDVVEKNDEGVRKITILNFEVSMNHLPVEETKDEEGTETKIISTILLKKFVDAQTVIQKLLTAKSTE